jgi:hypothetical protein
MIARNPEKVAVSGLGADIISFSTLDVSVAVDREEIVRVEYMQDWVPGQPPVRVMADRFPDGHVEFWEQDFGVPRWRRFMPLKRDSQVVSERLKRLCQAEA